MNRLSYITDGGEITEQRELTVLERHHTYNTGHNNTDLNPLQYLSPGIQVNTKYINSMKVHPQGGKTMKINVCSGHLG